ncbi:MAG TPA: sigma-70 family RNA polymerase sigma factor [Dehalococcoidia bacterium]|nr:sigma-70 family RNA polymerase sigma factor [Dehalococcoidia bacterium]
MTTARAYYETAAPRVAERPTLSELPSFTEVYDHYFPKVYAFAQNRLNDEDLALDIASAVFEKAYLKMGSLRSPDSIGSWLFAIARNEMVTHWRKEKPVEEAWTQATWELSLTSQHAGPEERLLKKEEAAALARLVQQLPPREQEVIALKFDAELTNREIANVLDTTEINIRVAVFRGLRRLRNIIDKNGLYQGGQ